MFKELTMHFPTKLNNMEHKQDVGHIYQLDERAKNFNECFLGVNINIKIYYENNFPIILFIEYLKDNKIIKKERYIKVAYIDDYMNTRYTDNILLQTEDENNEIKDILQHYETPSTRISLT